MSNVSLQDIRELMEFFENHREVRHVELRNDLQKFIDKSDKRIRILEKAEDKRVAFRSYLKPIFISVVTAAIIGGFGYYVS